MSIAKISLTVIGEATQGAIPFYPGWSRDHAVWTLISYTYAGLAASGAFTTAQMYFASCAPPLLAIIIFGLFGATQESRASYLRVLHSMAGWLRWKSTRLA